MQLMRAFIIGLVVFFIGNSPGALRSNFLFGEISSSFIIACIFIVTAIVSLIGAFNYFSSTTNRASTKEGLLLFAVIIGTGALVDLARRVIPAIFDNNTFPEALPYYISSEFFLTALVIATAVSLVTLFKMITAPTI